MKPFVILLFVLLKCSDCYKCLHFLYRFHALLNSRENRNGLTSNSQRISLKSTFQFTNAIQESLPLNPVEMNDPIDCTNNKLWKKYLIEFRGGFPFYRYPEFEQSFQSILRRYNIAPQNEHRQMNLFTPHAISEKLLIRTISRDGDRLIYSQLINDTMSDMPICAYVYLPNEHIAIKIANRCGLIRTIIEVWGEGEDPQTACQLALQNFKQIISPIFNNSNNQTNTWKVDFLHFGRKTGLDYKGKQELLSQFGILLRQLGSGVDLQHPTHELVYLEDWNDFHESFDNNQKYKLNVDQSISNRTTATKYSQQFTSKLSLIGRIIGTGSNIDNQFSLKTRPYVGTTTMQPICSHIAAVFANISPQDFVLDPFCGTGSLLIACGNLGAEVIGSDVDPECAREWNPSNEIEKYRLHRLESKNKKFIRKNGMDQANVCNYDNFKYYKLEDKLRLLVCADAFDWIVNDNLMKSVTNKIGTSFRAQPFPKFDAIVTDPPFGIREKAFINKASYDYLLSLGLIQLEDSEMNDKIVEEDGTNELLNPQWDVKSGYMKGMGNNRLMIYCLFIIAVRRLKDNGRLVFFLPAPPNQYTLSTMDETMTSYIIQVEKSLSIQDSTLKIVNIIEEPLNSRLTRWLCVLQKVSVENVKI